MISKIYTISDPVFPQQRITETELLSNLGQFVSMLDQVSYIRPLDQSCPFPNVYNFCFVICQSRLSTTQSKPPHCKFQNAVFLSNFSNPSGLYIFKESESYHSPTISTASWPSDLSLPYITPQIHGSLL